MLGRPVKWAAKQSSAFQRHETTGARKQEQVAAPNRNELFAWRSELSEDSWFEAKEGKSFRSGRSSPTMHACEVAALKSRVAPTLVCSSADRGSSLCVDRQVAKWQTQRGKAKKKEGKKPSAAELALTLDLPNALHTCDEQGSRSAILKNDGDCVLLPARCVPQLRASQRRSTAARPPLRISLLCVLP